MSVHRQKKCTTPEVTGSTEGQSVDQRHRKSL